MTLLSKQPGRPDGILPSLRGLAALFLLSLPVLAGAAGQAVAEPAKDAQPQWHELAAWTHAWDMRDAVTYVPDAAERKHFGIDASVRIESVPDRGSNNMPLRRDSGHWGDLLFKNPALPGPLYRASDAHFNGRPAFFADPVFKIGGGGFHNIHSMLAPVANPQDSSTYFNAPHGYAPPYWVAVLAHPPVGEVYMDDVRSAAAVMDTFRGATGAGPTFGGSYDRKNWGVACFGPIPPGFFWPALDLRYRPQTVLAMVYVGIGLDGSWVEINWREQGELKTLRQAITLGAKPDGSPLPFEEMFQGYAETMQNSAIAIKLGTPSEAETDAVRAWAAPYITESAPVRDAPEEAAGR